MYVSPLSLFERLASASPDAAAIVFQSRVITYGQLNELAGSIAAELFAAGVTPGSLVGVLLDRSPEMVAALLGIWKAGSAWVPLDLLAPDERLQSMIHDASASLVLTSQKDSHRIPGARIFLIEDLRKTKDSGRAPCEPASPGDVAYAIYTSGSTGTPKAARITHGGLANTLQGVAQDLALTSQDVVLAWSTLAFDVACMEILLPLIAGCSLCLLQNNTAREGGPTPEALRDSGATVLFGTPTMFRVLLERGWSGDPKIQVVTGGEALPLSLARTLAQSCRSVWNQYGPTETSICATRAKLTADAEKVTIGKPLPNVTVHLLDSNLQPVQPGSIGELYISGAGVGTGYLHRPELNRQCFLPNPFSTDPSGLLYKTGDLAIQLADGNFDFLGRVDHQVKIRGYRIELGEIESVLLQCEGVQAAVVRAIELEPGDRRLIAFVTGDANLSAQWKTFLQQRLPEYMVPSEFILLTEFPTSASAKVDLRALDAMRLARSITPSHPEESDPSSLDSTETRVIESWKKILQLNAVGLDDDFFALGGHSLLAARMLAALGKSFDCRLPHSVLVEHPTPRRLAAYLRSMPGPEWPAVVTIQAGQSASALFVAHGIGGSVLSFRELAAELGPQQTVHGLQLPDVIEPSRTGFENLASTYVGQMRRLQPSGPYFLAGHSSGGVIAYEIACQLTEMGEAVGLLALLDCDPNTGKVVRHPFADWASLKAACRRAFAELTNPDFTLTELLLRRLHYQKLKIKIWLAARARSGKNVRAAAEGYLALALREYELRPYPGDAVLFIAQDEPGRAGDPTGAWKDKILGKREVVVVPGTHHTMLSRPHAETLAREIGERINAPALHGVSRFALRA
jgi:amino acid adenylation domain-containing protein